MLRVCSELSFLPLDMKSESGEAYGYEIDILKAFAEKFHYQLKYVEISWTASIPALIAKKCDLIASGLSPSEERNALVNFTDSTYEIVDQFVIKKENKEKFKLKSFSDFDQKFISIGVRQGNETDVFLKKKFRNAKIFQYPNSDADVITALLEDKVTAVALHSPTAATVVKAHPKILMTIDDPIPVKTFHVAYAVRKDSSGDKLRDEFHVFFDQFKKTKQWKEIYQKFFQ